jgi:eukaryotic-like serine/threonine-protein kinase
MKVCPHCCRCYEDSFDSCAHDQSALAAGRAGARLVARKYMLDRLLEEAAGQTVYSGRHTETGRPYAVKLLLPDARADAEAAKDFRRAALAAAHLNTRVDHQHVAKTYDYGLLTDGTVYVVTELVGGQSLRRHMDETGPLPAATAAHIARQVADGLEAAHRHGIYHHDLDPSRVVLTRGHDERPEVKVVDFGLAALRKHGADENAEGAAENVGGPPTRRRSIVPASPYAAPEQLGGQSADARSDLYSLGALLYEMLSGAPPPAPARRGDADGPPPVFAVRDDVPIPLARLVSQLLRARASARPHSAAEVSKRLRAAEELLAAGGTGAPAADVQALPAEEPAPPAAGRATGRTFAAAAGTTRTPPVSINPGAHEPEPDSAAYDDLDALQEELGGDLDEIIVAASSPASLRGQSPAARPPAVGNRRREAAGRPRLALILFTTLAAVVTGVAFGLWATRPSAPATPAPPRPDTASAAPQGESTPAETPPDAEAAASPAGDTPAPSASAADDRTTETGQGAADERAAAEGADAPSAKVVGTRTTAEGEARRAAAAAAAAPAGTASSTAPVAREVGKPSEGRCVLSVSEGSLSIPAGGGSGTITVSAGGEGRVRAATDNWPDIAVFSDGRGGEGGRVRYTVISVSKRAGTFAVHFNSPCGTKTVPVTVRQR